MFELTHNLRRLIVGVVLIIALFCLVVFYGGFGLFGRYSGEAVAASFILLFLAIAYIGPTPGEMEERHNKRREKLDSKSQ